MASEGHIFSVAGPLHLTAVDWQNPHHRRSIAATLVQGVYVLEHDRQQSRQEKNALAPPWWEVYHFNLDEILIDDTDYSYFGTIFEYKYPNYYSTPTGGLQPPHYIIAFRGTLTKPDTRAQDLKLDLRCVFNRLERSSRFQLAIQAVQRVVSKAGPTNVWLAGHSLGSAISLLVGRYMVNMGFHLETYLFNPPFIRTPTELIKNEKVKHGVRFTGSIIKAGIASVVKNHCPNKDEEKNEPFRVLSQWIPYLFLNPTDPICSEYIGYFQHRTNMENIGFGDIERVSTQSSFGSLILGAVGRESDPSHLLPSAYLTINLGPIQDFRQAHGVEQWWNPNFVSHSMLHQYK
jgi:hypothetical protein